MPAYESIADRWNSSVQALQTRQNARVFGRTLCQLGIQEGDEKAVVQARALFEKIVNSKTKVSASSHDSGVYFLYAESDKGDRPVGAFKVGLRRAANELFARAFACQLHLEDHAVCGVLAAFENPDWTRVEQTVEELWNGHEKRYLSRKLSGKSVITGILEPWLEPNDEARSHDIIGFTRMVIVALALGLRDAKPDGYRYGYCLVDLEDHMPARLDPLSDEQAACAATHLPLLSSPLSEQTIPTSAVLSLGELAQEWNLETIETFLRSYNRALTDDKVERCKPGERGTDEGGLPFSVHKMPPHPVDGFRSVEAPAQALFSKEQVAACLMRLQRVRSCLSESIAADRPLRPLDIVFSVDPFYAKQYQHASCMKAAKHVDQKVQRFWFGFARERVFEILGLVPSSKCVFKPSAPMDSPSSS